MFLDVTPIMLLMNGYKPRDSPGDAAPAIEKLKSLTPFDLVKAENCYDGWKQYGESCYKLFNNAVNWTTASEQCQSMGSRLVSFETRKERYDIRSMAAGQKFWIGLRRRDGSDEFFWESGNPGYVEWATNEPMQKHDKGWECVADNFVPPGGTDPQMDDQLCKNNLPYMCEYTSDQARNKADVAALLNNTEGDLVLMFTADTQLEWNCETNNIACKNYRVWMRDAHGMLNCESDHRQKSKNLYEFCNLLDGTVSNVLQKQVMADIAMKMRFKPAGLVINGDLTAFGHATELERFQDIWSDFPIPSYYGLGNHDYANNVDDCVDNHCASRMIDWFIMDAKNKNIPLEVDYHFLPGIAKRDTVRYFYRGSLAYKVSVTSADGNNRGLLIQLHLEPNYNTTWVRMIWPYQDYLIRTSVSFLKQSLEFQRWAKRGDPVFINLHNFSPDSHKIIVEAIKAQYGTDNAAPVFILHGHLHHLHQVDKVCANYEIPSIYVGCVPKNRFTIIKIKNDAKRTSEIFMMRADFEGKRRSATILEVIRPDFKPC